MSRYALLVDGWDHYSVWGYEDLDESYFAQLWANESDGDGPPDVHLNWFTRSEPIRLLVLVLMIDVVTHAGVAVVAQRLADSLPDSHPDRGLLTTMARSRPAA
jgi:hypothetical protein